MRCGEYLDYGILIFFFLGWGFWFVSKFVYFFVFFDLLLGGYCVLFMVKKLWIVGESLGWWLCFGVFYWRYYCYEFWWYDVEMECR